MRKSSLLVVLGVGAAAVAAIYASWHYWITHGEMAEKQGWSTVHALQIIHQNDRNVRQPIVATESLELDFIVLGLPSTDSRYSLVWIILNEVSPRTSEVYLAPQMVPFEIACSYLRELGTKVQIHPLVLKYLKSRCVQ